MKNEKKPQAKKDVTKKTAKVKKTKKISLLDAAVMGAGMPTMGGI